MSRKSAFIEKDATDKHLQKGYRRGFRNARNHGSAQQTVKQSDTCAIQRNWSNGPSNLIRNHCPEFLSSMSDSALPHWPIVSFSLSNSVTLEDKNKPF